MNARFICLVLLLSSVLTLAACSSGDGAAPGTLITGSVFAAPVSAAEVSIVDRNGNAVAGPVTTDADGGYSIRIPLALLSTDLILQSSSGRFSDEATGQLTHAGELAVYIAAGSLGADAQVHATPATTIIKHMVMQQAMTLTQAQNTFQNVFRYLPDWSVAPTDATAPGSDTDTAQQLAGLRAAVFSQLTADLGFSPEQQFELLAAIAADLADGSADGNSAAGVVAVAGSYLPEDIINSYLRALMHFRNGNDQTALTNDQLGLLPQSDLALTESYRVEYVAVSERSAEGRSQFMLRIRNRADGSPVTGETVTLMPVMYMATHQHSTPYEAVTDSNNDGDYDATVYYLMPSLMGEVSMGFWEMKVMIGGMAGEQAVFYPDVYMAMGDTAKTVLKGQNDKIMSMTGSEEGRSYYIFNAGITAGVDYGFDVYIAARESMMAFPAVDTGVTLNAGDAGYQLDINTISVDVSTDGISWSAAGNNGAGHFSIDGLNLTPGVQNTIHVRLQVNGEYKTTDGSAPAGDGSNDYATFVVTP